MFEQATYTNGEYTLEYNIDYPKDFSPDKAYPVIFYFHGMGMVRKGVEALAQNAAVRRERIPEDIPFIIVAPSCQDFMWFENMNNVISFVEDIISLDYVDKTKVYLTGASMGGYTCWMLSVLRPKLFAAAVICCGGGTYWSAYRIKFPVIAYHGTEDNVVLPRESEIMVQKINEHGGNARLVLCEGVDHSVWNVAFTDKEVYKWLYSQKK